MIISSSEESAQQALHQLQAACAFVGLFINVSKTECMAVGLHQAEISSSEAVKERGRVRWNRAEYDGWLMDWSGRSKQMDEKSL